MKISIIGTGYVGNITGKALQEMRHNIIFYSASKSGSNITNDIENAVINSDISFITKATPTINGVIDITHVKEAALQIGKILKNKKNYHLIVIRSTITPRTTEKIILPILERASGKRPGIDFGLAVNPEFIREVAEEDAIKEFFEQKKIVIGEYDKKSGDLLEKIYETLNAKVFRTDMKTAETIKYASNIMLATKISCWNEIHYITEKIGVDSDIVAHIVGLDNRIGYYGTKTGRAFGGACLPKDIQAFVGFAKENGYHPELLEAAININNRIHKEKGVSNERAI